MIHSNCMSNVDIDETGFVSKCTTHANGAKCSIKLEGQFKTAELSERGLKKMLEERFS